MTPTKAAYKLTHILNTVASSLGTPRFPIDVKALALDAHRCFQWSDAIVEVRAASIDRFEGALFPNDARSEWMLLYNDQLRSPGRVRFTQAHELGHYILHRITRDSFQCSSDDMLHWSDDEKDLEAQADLFAATLLMPLDDYRQQVSGRVDFDVLAGMADRYGMSLTAATLRWLEHTDQIAMLVVHRDGFMLWARSSTPAMKAGAFFKTKAKPNPIPLMSLAANDQVSVERTGQEAAARIWFPLAEEDTPIRELKITADHYDWCMSLLIFPNGTWVWPPFSEK